jgi:hypothetical protein
MVNNNEISLYPSHNGGKNFGRGIIKPSTDLIEDAR